jgi:EAL domain-containing protein (putative c-di-GMP-specific phosphodiesterase class I)/FixJ family two-component response regulator
MPESGRLLILDDDITVGQAIASTAERFGFAVAVTSSAKDFFDAVGQWEPSHAAIDLAMPEMDGVEVLRRLARLRSPVKVILMSGMGTKVLDSAHQSALEHGLEMSGILPKPFRAARLRALLLQDSAPQERASAGNGNSHATRSITSEDIEEGIRARHFVLHFQPKIRLPGREVTGFEALVRWQHPSYGLLFPDTFIPLAEQSATMSRLTHHIIEGGLHWLAGLGNSTGLSLSLNLSARDLDDMVLAEHLQQACVARGVAPTDIVLEITETSTTRNPVETLDLLTRLRLKGFNLAMDDFGTGYSTLVQLARLPFSELKIDKSFVAQMRTSREARKIVESTTALSRKLGLTIVAEGVEDGPTLGLLEEAGCDFAQGYFISRPMPGDAVRPWLRRYAAHPSIHSS